MGITWGSWEYSGGNGMRVGIEVTWKDQGTAGAITHATTIADADVFIYTENQYSYSDSQTLTYGGSISGTQGFTNNSAGGGLQVQRDNVDYNYTYTTYGSSPGSRSFSASLSGAFNGVTPSVSVSSSIPARPYAAPAAPTTVSAVRVSDTSTKVQWINHSTAGEPWDTLSVARSINGGAYSLRTTTLAGASTSYTDATVANAKYRYEVRSQNSIGVSAYVISGDIWTTPATPVITAALTPVAGPTGQRITWANTGMGYSEYSTEVVAYKNGVSVGTVGTVTTGGTTFDHTTANGVSAYTTTDRWKYTVRHKTTSGTALYSVYTGFTDETLGTSSPPAVSTNLSPAGGAVVDPTLPTVLSWTYNATDGSSQSRAQIQYRLSGAGTWTTPADFAQVVANGATGNYTSIPANTFGDGNTVEWQVATKGADAVYGPWSVSATYTYTITVITPDPVKLPMQMNITTGDIEASTTAYLIRDWMMRAQAKMPGGGVKTVDSSFNLSWSSRFIPIALGQDQALLPLGYHEITTPFSWTITNKALSGNVATLTINANTNRMRVGDTIIVSGVDATFNGTFVVRSTESNKVSYDKVATNVTGVASGGNVGCSIQGHGGATSAVPTTASKIAMSGSWYTLYYEMVSGWGGGTISKKNGVVSVTNKALTTNVATLTVVAPHYFAIGDRIQVAIGDAVFDGVALAITGLTATTISYAKVNANVTSAAATGYAKPLGIDTFFGNFHMVVHGSDFIVPGNWLRLALRNADNADTIEWCTGESDTGWITPSLLNSWVYFGSPQAVPAYRKLNGVVYLKGLIKNGTLGVGAFVLPSGFRPSELLIMSGVWQSQTNTSGAATAGTAHTHAVAAPQIGIRIDVSDDGTVIMYGGASASNGYASLSGISFIAGA